MVLADMCIPEHIRRDSSHIAENPSHRHVNCGASTMHLYPKDIDVRQCNAPGMCLVEALGHGRH